MTTLPMIVDLRLVRLRDGRWRIRTGDALVTVPAMLLPEAVRAVVADIATPRSYARSRFEVCPVADRGALPGSYVFTSDRGVHGGNEGEMVGAKPLALMLALVDDYTREGDVVFDPCAGGGTTLLAAVMEGRRAVGAELDPITFDKAVARLRKGYTAPLAFDAPTRMEQTGLSFPMDDEPLPEEPIDREPEHDPSCPDCWHVECVCDLPREAAQ